MNIEEVKRRVEKVREVQYDQEVAHSLEDGLLIDVLKAVAEGKADSPSALASEALKVRDIDYERWRA